MAQTKVSLIKDGVIVVGHLHTNHGITTGHIGEGSNLYFTDARVMTSLGSVSTHIIPDTNIAYDLGSPTNRFRDLYLSSNTIHLGTDTKITVNNDGEVEFKDSSDAPKRLKIRELDFVDDQGRNKRFKIDATSGRLATFDAVGTLTADKLDLSAMSTTDLSEGSNLYYTDARVGTYLTTNSYATQVYVNQKISDLVASAPTTLDTLNELAAALGDDPNFATTVSGQIGTKWTQDNAKIANWDAAYGWGNHASVGYLTTVGWNDVTGKPSTFAPSAHNHDDRYYTETESDARFAPKSAYDVYGTGYGWLLSDYDGSSNKMRIYYDDGTKEVRFYSYHGAVGAAKISLHSGSSFTSFGSSEISNWNTAYGWGNHASAGYLTSLPSHDHTILKEAGSISYGTPGLQWFDLSGVGGSGVNGGTPSNPFNDWHHHLIMNHANSAGYYVDMAYSFHDDRVHFRRNAGNSFGSWREFIHSGNIGSFAITSETDTLDSVADRGRSTNQQLISTNPAGFRVDSGSYARIELDSNNNWSYVRLMDNGVTTWDIACLDGADLQMRPGGGSSNRVWFSQGGNLTIESGSLYFNTSNNSGRLYSDDWGLKIGTTSGYIHFGPANTGHAHIYTDRANFYFNKQLTVSGGSQVNSGDVRANIFYDNNNTAYFTDPASTSYLNSLNINGGNVWMMNGRTLSLSGDPDTFYPVVFPHDTRHNIIQIRKHVHDYQTWDGRLAAEIHSWSSTWGGDQGYAYLAKNRYNNRQYIAKVAQSAGPNNYVVVWLRGARSYNVYTSPVDRVGTPYYSTTDLGGSNGSVSPTTTVDFGNVYWQTNSSGEWISNTKIVSNDSMQSPILYDGNNTSYYINPDGLSYINEIRSNEAQANPRYDTAFYVLQAQHWYGDNSSQTMYIGESGNTVNLRGRLDAAIMYDYNNTGYYCDPASTSNFNTVYLNAQDWGGTITWNSGVNINVSGESSFDLLGSGAIWQVWTANNSQPSIYVTYAGQTEIGLAGNRGLKVHGNLTVNHSSTYGTGMDLTFSGSSATGMLIRNNTGSTKAAISFYYSSAPQGARGTIMVSSTSTAYNTSSDYRLKENFEPITDGIDRVKLLQPKRFNFIGDDVTVDGFVAHETQEVVPESITGVKDEVDEEGNPVYQGIDQAKLVPLLTAALQEAIAKIESLEARIQVLENQ